jgi:hypothetical protein
MLRAFSPPVISKVTRFFTALHEDERGDNENLGRLLMLALVLVPLVILIIFFGDAIYAKAKEMWSEVMGETVG